MVARALDVSLEVASSGAASRAVRVTLTNVGAAHYLPTGTPDRHLTLRLRLLDGGGRVLKERHEKLMRTILWRSFIVDLWDTRLPLNEPRSYELQFPDAAAAASAEVVVRYHLLEERRRKRIGYANEEPIAYEVFRRAIDLDR